LGRVLERRRHPRASVVLRNALSRTEGRDWTLVSYDAERACLRAGEWRAAQAILGERHDRHGSAPDAHEPARLAAAAAQVGDRDEAIRLWKEALNLDRSVGASIEPLLVAGLRQPLVDLYARLASEDPASVELSRTSEYLRATK